MVVLLRETLLLRTLLRLLRRALLNVFGSISWIVRCRWYSAISNERLKHILITVYKDRSKGCASNGTHLSLIKGHTTSAEYGALIWLDPISFFYSDFLTKINLGR